MVDEEVEEDGVIYPLYSEDGAILCCFGSFFIIMMLGILPSIVLYVINIWLIILIWIGVISLIVIAHYYLSKTYCTNCKEFVYPIFIKHVCEFNIKDQKSKMKKIINNH